MADHAANAATLLGAGAALMLGVSGPHGFLRVVLPTVLVAGATLAVVALPRLLRARQHAPRWVRAIGAGVLDAEQTTFKDPGWRLIGALGYLGFDMAVLWVSLAAVGPAPNVPALILAYNIGYLANWLPIPGGIGALDAGLTGPLALYGISATHAATAVVVYHAIALLVPGVGGLLAYIRLRPRLTKRVTVDDGNFDSSVTCILGVEMRLVYGILAPTVFVLGLIVLLALNPVTWLLVVIVVVEVGALAFVITRLLGMMSGNGDDPPS